MTPLFCCSACVSLWPITTGRLFRAFCGGRPSRAWTCRPPEPTRRQPHGYDYVDVGSCVIGEPPEDPLLLFSVLCGSWAEKLGAANRDVVLELAMQFLALAEKQGTTAPLMIGHRLIGISLMLTGNIVQSLRHLDEAIALYDPATHRPLATVLSWNPACQSWASEHVATFSATVLPFMVSASPWIRPASSNSCITAGSSPAR